MIPLPPSGYTVRAVATATTPEELNYFEPLEQGLPEFARVVLEVPLDPSEDIATVAQQVEAACLSNGIPNWPEYPTTHTFIEGNILYVAYVKASPWVQFIIPVLLAVVIIGPIILWFASETFREVITLLLVLPIMLIMMSLMTKMIPGVPRKPKEELPPFEERVTARLEKLGERIARIEDLFRVSVSSGAGEVTGIASEIGSIARTVRAAPEATMRGVEKARATREMGKLHRKLAEYESKLTDEQREKLEEERRIVEELRSMYP